MKFTPRLLKEDVNISRSSPLRELLVLLGAIIGGLLIIYLALGFALDILVDRTPVKLERTAGNFFGKIYNLEGLPTAKELEIQRLLDDLTMYFPEKDAHFVVHIQEGADVNALALPGRHILIFSELLKAVKSENELAMTLAHELGHFAHRDHLRGLGRGLVLVFISGVLFGVDSAVFDFTQKSLITAELKFSRQQEVAADLFALELLNKKYGHVGGSCAFFEHIKGKEHSPRFLKFLSTHPYPSDRIKILKEQIAKKGYLIADQNPLVY